MAAKVIDGKASAAKLREKIVTHTAELKSKYGLQPGLATVLVGDDPASQVYVRKKRETAEAIGFKSVSVELPATVGQDELLAQVKALCVDVSVHGILVQLPLPKHLDEIAVLDVLAPAKDVDALTPINTGLLLSGRAHLVGCTPSGVMLLLKEYVGDIQGKEALVIGRYAAFWQTRRAASSGGKCRRHDRPFPAQRTCRGWRAAPTSSLPPSASHTS